MFRSLFSHAPRQRQAPTAVQQMTVAELHQRILQNDSALELVDVRTPGEYAHDGHIAGSRLPPLSSLMARAAELPKDKTIVCICRSGNRSYTACEMLAAQGFKTINLSGGMLHWRATGLPTN